MNELILQMLETLKEFKSEGPDLDTPLEAKPNLPRSWIVVKNPPSNTLKQLLVIIYLKT